MGAALWFTLKYCPSTEFHLCFFMHRKVQYVLDTNIWITDVKYELYLTVLTSVHIWRTDKLMNRIYLKSRDSLYLMFTIGVIFHFIMYT